MSKKKARPQPTATARTERYNPMRISMLSMGMSREIHVIRRYIETVTSSFAREFKSYEESLAKQAADAPDHEIQRLAEDRAEAQYFLIRHFPAFALQTTFVATYSLLEDHMMALAGVVGDYLGLGIDPDDLKDKGVHAAKKYLEKLCGITFPASKHPWQQVLQYNRLRNVFAHSRGHVREGNNEIRTYVASKESVTIDQHDQLQLTKEFCLEVLENVEALMNDLFKLARARAS